MRGWLLAVRMSRLVVVQRGPVFDCRVAQSLLPKASGCAAIAPASVEALRVLALRSRNRRAGSDQPLVALDERAECPAPDTMLLSAVITVVTGAKSFGECNPLASDTVLVFSELTAVISGWNAFAAPREVWRLKTLTLGRLLSLQGRLEFSVRSPEFERERADILKSALADFDVILADYNQEWQSLRSSGK
jgi:hypothetical protein